MPMIGLGVACDPVIATEMCRSSWRNSCLLKSSLWVVSSRVWKMWWRGGGADVISGQLHGSSLKSEEGSVEREAQVPNDVVDADSASRPPRIWDTHLFSCLMFRLLLFSCSVVSDSFRPHVLHHLPEFDQTHVHWVDVAIQPSHPLSSPSPPALIFPHQGLFQWLGSSHQVARVLELQLQLQHQSFQWIFKVDFL